MDAGFTKVSHDKNVETMQHTRLPCLTVSVAPLRPAAHLFDASRA